MDTIQLPLPPDLLVKKSLRLPPHLSGNYGSALHPHRYVVTSSFNYVCQTCKTCGD